MRNLTSIFIILSAFFFSSNVFASDSHSEVTLRSGWYFWDPYQYIDSKDGFETLTGLDIQLANKISKDYGKKVSYQEIGWKQHIDNIKSGEMDIAAGATYSDERAEFAYFSVPYRYEENSLFTFRDKVNNYKFNNIAELLKAFQHDGHKVGVTNGFIYADPQINKWVAEPGNRKYIVQFENDAEALQGLISGKVNCFLADRIVGATVIWRAGQGKKVAEVNLEIKTPIHFMLSKKSFTPEMVTKFNQSINTIKESKEYAKIVSGYLYPILLMQTVDTQWFKILGLIGIITFAISGLVIAHQINATVFGAFILAILPSLGGGIIRDVMFTKRPVGATESPSFLLIIIVTVIIGFILIRLGRKYFEMLENSKHNKYRNYLNTTVEICDAAGLAAFTVTGIIVAIIAKVHPLWLWGPFCAFLTGASGGILRDVFSNPQALKSVKGEGIYPEIAIIWGLFLSLALGANTHNYNPETIRNLVMITVTGAFVTRLIVWYFKIPNLKFSPYKSKAK